MSNAFTGWFTLLVVPLFLLMVSCESSAGDKRGQNYLINRSDPFVRPVAGVKSNFLLILLSYGCVTIPKAPFGYGAVLCRRGNPNPGVSPRVC